MQNYSQSIIESKEINEMNNLQYIFHFLPGDEQGHLRTGKVRSFVPDADC